MNEGVWSIRGLVMTESIRSTVEQTCTSANLCATNLILTDLGLNPGLRGESPTTFRFHNVQKLLVSHNYSRPVDCSCLPNSRMVKCVCACFEVGLGILEA